MGGWVGGGWVGGWVGRGASSSFFLLLTFRILALLLVKPSVVDVMPVFFVVLEFVFVLLKRVGGWVGGWVGWVEILSLYV